MKRLIHRYGVLTAYVGRHPADLRRLVSSSNAVFGSLAGVQDSISASVARLPGSLRATERALTEVRGFAPLLRTTLESLRAPVRQLPATNAALTPFFKPTTPVLRNEIRPFVRAARPFTNDLRLASKDLAQATPDLTKAFGETNRFFNMGAYNPGGAESLGGLTTAQQRARNEGFLYWLAWTSQNGVSLFSTADSQGPWRRVTICGVPPPILQSIIGGVLTYVNKSEPGSGGEPDRRRGHHHPTDQPDRAAARDRVRLLQLRDADAMNKNPPTLGQIAAMVAFTLSVFACCCSCGCRSAARCRCGRGVPRSRRTSPRPHCCAKEADVRIAGVNVGKVKSTELGPGGRTTQRRDGDRHRFAPIKVDTRAILRQKSLLGETYVELTPGQPDAKTLPGRRDAARANVDDTVQLDEVFRTFDPRTRRYFQEWLHDAGHRRRRGQFGSDLNDALGNAAPFFAGGADLLRPLAEQEVALRRVVRDTGRVVPRDLARERAAARAGHERRGDLLGALASRDDGAGGDLPDPADVPARDAHDGRRLAELRAQHRPAGARPAQPADDLAPDAARPRRPVARPRAAVPRRRPAGATPRRPAFPRPQRFLAAPSRCWRRRTAS